MVGQRAGSAGGKLMFDVSGSGGRARLAWTTAKVAVAVAFLSLFATDWLSRGGLANGPLARLAGRPAEPNMTGSVVKAKDVKLDPCAAPKRS